MEKLNFDNYTGIEMQMNIELPDNHGGTDVVKVEDLEDLNDENGGIIKPFFSLYLRSEDGLARILMDTPYYRLAVEVLNHLADKYFEGYFTDDASNLFAELIATKVEEDINANN